MSPRLCSHKIFGPDRRRRDRRRTLKATILALLAPFAALAGNPPADLRLEWDGLHVGATEGVAGKSSSLPYRLRNVGGRDAFAVLLRAETALGPLGKPQRLEPGPKAGETRRRTLTLPLADGMREVCIEVSLQNLRVDEPADPNPQDNRICRELRVSPASQKSASPELPSVVQQDETPGGKTASADGRLDSPGSRPAGLGGEPSRPVGDRR